MQAFQCWIETAIYHTFNSVFTKSVHNVFCSGTGGWRGFPLTHLITSALVTRFTIPSPTSLPSPSLHLSLSHSQSLSFCSLFLLPQSNFQTIFLWTKSDISYVNISWAFEHCITLKSSPGSHSQSVNGSTGIASSCSLSVCLTLHLPLLLGILILYLC